MRKQKQFCMDPKPSVKKSLLMPVCRKPKIPLSSAVRNLGLIVDAGVTMQDHISNAVRGCFYHPRSLGKLRLFLSAKGSKYYSCFCGVVPTCLLQQLLMGGVPSQQLKRPQLVQNTDARTVTRTR